MTHPGLKSRRPAFSRLFAKAHMHVLARLAALRLRRRPGGPYEGAAGGALGRLLRRPRVARGVKIAGVLAVVAALAMGGLWWRLGSGPIPLDIVSPWLMSSLEQRLGGGHRIEFGGTQIERDEDGRTAIRIRDIVVRAADGGVVANAPKADVGVSGMGLLTGTVQAERISLIGAVMSVRIEPDGQVRLFSGDENHPLAKAPVAVSPGRRSAPALAGGHAGGGGAAPAERSLADTFNLFLNWVEGLDAFGLDGRGLTEVGLRSGTLVVDDRRAAKKWTFENINMSLTRPREGGVAFAVNSSGSDGPWSLTATVTPRGGGLRSVEAVLRDFSPRDLLLAMRFDDAGMSADMPISAILRADIGADGVPTRAEARIIAGAGHFGDLNEPENRVLVDEANLTLQWDAARRQINIPIEIFAGGSRITLLARAEAPREPDGAWNLGIVRGLIILGSRERTREAPLIIDRIALRARIDPTRRRIDLDQGDFTGMAAGIAMSGTIDYSEAEPRLAIGLAGTRMTALSLMRIWPVFIAPDVRAWVATSLLAGTVERVVIATNAPIPTLKKGGPPIPDDGLSIEMKITGATLRPVNSLPDIRESDVSVRISGRNAVVEVGRGVAELASGRKLTLAGGHFEVPDTDPKRPPARIRMRVDAPVDAVAEFITLAPINEPAGALFDPATSRGAAGATINLAFPVARDVSRPEVTYQIDAEITNFAAERFVRGQKAEAASLRVTATPQALQARGDMRIGGMPASVEYRKPVGATEAEIRVQATMDDAARARFGVETGNAVSGPLPVKLTGKLGDRDNRFAVDLDLLQVKVNDLVPGWNKAAGKPGRASAVIIDRPQGVRFEDIVIDGSGTSIRGAVELDSEGEIISANLPTFALSDGDKASVKADRASDGTLRVIVRGDVFDGRGFVKASMKSTPDKKSAAARDIDLDLRVGAIAGYNGEALRALELRMMRRAGQIRNFAVNAKIGREATLLGELRVRGGRSVIYVETDDAGALFRFSDTYPRMVGGQMWVTMDPPTADLAPQDGVLNIRDFTVRGEAALDRVASSAPATADSGPRVAPGAGVQFSRARVDFTRTSGKLALREGLVWGPAVGATIEGQVDYGRDDVRLRGTFVPAYALNNMIARIPIVGIFLGGSQNEGLLGITYEVAGTPSAPVLRVNPMSAVAPGFLRKIFEFRGGDDRAAAPPVPDR